MRENHYAILAQKENFSGFHSHDEHNASFSVKYVIVDIANDTTNIRNFYVK